MSSDKPSGSNIDSPDEGTPQPAGSASENSAKSSASPEPDNENTTAQENTATEEKASAPAPKKTKRWGWFLFLLIIALLLAAAAGGVYFTQDYLRAQQTESAQLVTDQMTELQSELSLLQQQVQAQAQRFGNIESSLGAAKTDTESKLLSLAERVSQSETTGSGDWVLAEAEYLLRIANQRLVTSQDIGGAIEMMSASDRILRELAYPELTEARRQLVADMTKLSMVQPVDYEGIYFALDAMLQSVASVSGAKLERLSSEAGDGASASGWRSFWGQLAGALSPYVVINSSSEVEPQYLISDAQETMIKSEIQLQIRQAQLAMLAGEEVLYAAALTGAADKIESVFVEDEVSGPLASSLRDFAARSVSNQSVDISGSIRAVENVVDQLTRAQHSVPEASDQ